MRERSGRDHDAGAREPVAEHAGDRRATPAAIQEAKPTNPTA